MARRSMRRKTAWMGSYGTATVTSGSTGFAPVFTWEDIRDQCGPEPTIIRLIGSIYLDYTETGANDANQIFGYIGFAAQPDGWTPSGVRDELHDDSWMATYFMETGGSAVPQVYWNGVAEIQVNKHVHGHRGSTNNHRDIDIRAARKCADRTQIYMCRQNITNVGPATDATFHWALRGLFKLA